MSTPEVAAERWSLAQRIGFRFAFIYSILFTLPFPIFIAPGTDPLTELYYERWYRVAEWVGRRLLHIEVVYLATTGSGDTTFAYVTVLCFSALAAAGTLVWSSLDRRRAEHAKLHDGLRVYVRYYLAVVMIGYGVVKVIKTQFPFPGPDRLMKPLGEASPMWLLWSFMGYSKAYNVFTGAAELGGGVLLFFRRTTTLGALVLAAVLANVVMLNFCYDVPVKLNSLHYLIFCGLLLLPDARRLADVFVLNRPTEPVAPRRPFSARWMEQGRLGAKALLIGWVLFSKTSSTLEYQSKMGDEAPRHPLYGLYEVEAFLRNGEEQPPLLTDSRRWRAVAVDRYSKLTVRGMDDKTTRFGMKDDPEKKEITLSTGPDPESPKIVLAYSRPDPERLTLEGSFEGEALTVRLRRVDESKYLLLNRGFRWIQE